MPAVGRCCGGFRRSGDPILGNNDRLLDKTEQTKHGLQVQLMTHVVEAGGLRRSSCWGHVRAVTEACVP